MLAEYKAADSYSRAIQARSMADSGIYYTAALLSNPDAYTNTLNSNPFENPQAFQAFWSRRTISRASGAVSALSRRSPRTRR
jgi:hypothetical protein